MKLGNDNKVAVLSDSFKSTISSTEMGELWQERCRCDYLPVSAGGEGIQEALAATKENMMNTLYNYNNFITKYKKENNMYKGVLFDLDGVICDTARLHYLAWKRLANELGGDIDEEFNETLKGVDRTESLNRILKHIGIELNSELFTEAMTKKNDWYVESLNTLSPADILPGMESFIKDLVANDVKIAIASASRNAPNILEKIGVMQYVDTIADPAEVKENKPAPDIFLLAAKQLGLDKSDCIGIEDSQAGIDALNSGGIDSVAIGDVLEGATIKLSNTSQLKLHL
ncbi:MAG: beta-phosphoglucomutase [Erysipelotrichaceae bacterium]